MIFYDLGPGVRAFSSQLGDPIDYTIVTPAHQAHSTRVALIPDEQDDTYGVDALITNRLNVALTVRTADCVPILIYDPVARAVSAVHSGWKGTLNNILCATLKRMSECFGSLPQNLRAVIGPCIHQPAFEVGNDVSDLFLEANYNRFVALMPAIDDPERVKYHIDLPGICKQQLLDLGVNQVEIMPYCTFSNPDMFPSYRRDRSRERVFSSIMLVE